MYLTMEDIRLIEWLTKTKREQITKHNFINQYFNVYTLSNKRYDTNKLIEDSAGVLDFSSIYYNFLTLPVHINRCLIENLKYETLKRDISKDSDYRINETAWIIFKKVFRIGKNLGEPEVIEERERFLLINELKDIGFIYSSSRYGALKEARETNKVENEMYKLIYDKEFKL